MKLRSVYHTGEGEGVFSVGRWIIGWTWLLALCYSWRALKYNFSHEELWIPRQDFKISEWKCKSVFSDYDSLLGQMSPVGQCFSSTTRGDAEGVRFAPASEVLKHPERWRYIEYEVDDALWESYVLPKLKSMVGNKYDFVAVMTGFTTPVLIDDEKKNYCSGVCCFAKYLLDILEKLWKRVSPRRSAMLLVPRWGEPKTV